MNTFPLSALAFVFIGVLASFSVNCAQLPAGFVETQIATGLDPTAMVMAPDGRLFITEKDGKVRIVENGTLLPDHLLEITVDNYNERGLGGICLHPQFDLNGYFYLFYTVPGGNHNRVSRFTATGNFALASSEVVIIDLDVMGGTIHNGGAMGFGIDGKLYISAGDGAVSANAQNLNTTLGKILRVNDDGSLPTDNPFYNSLTGNNRAIWAYGFRNSFTFAIQPGTGLLFANDVGGGAFEEVNDVRRGRNYGWDAIEGQLAGQIPPTDYQDPLHAYNHNVGCSVIAAAFYNPELYTFPAEYHGKYFFGDYCAGFIKVLDPATGQIESTFATDVQRPVAMLTAPDGSLYYIERRGLGGGSETDNTSTNNGTLWRVSYTGSGAPFISRQPESLQLSVGEDAHFAVQASGVAPLSYQWRKNGELLPGAQSDTLLYPNVGITDDGSTFTCTVTNGQGEALSLSALLHVTANTRPLISLLLPLPDALYRAGDTIHFAAQVTDAEDGELDAGQLTWRIDFHHDTHTHPALTPVSGIVEGAFPVPQVGETDDNVWYKVWLTATDSEGLSRTVSREVYPEKVSFELHTFPEGLDLRVDGARTPTPADVASVAGLRRTVAAPGVQQAGNTLYLFEQWQDGSTLPTFSFLADAPGYGFTAFYTPLPLGSGDGLTGRYYDEVNHTFQDAPRFTRVDTTINFDWGGGSPSAATLGDDFFNMRWTGFVEPYRTDTYTFYVRADDGIRLWVDNQLLLDQWVPQPATEVAASITLAGGRRYPIQLDYFEDGGEAVCQLSWSSTILPKAIIPKSQLYTTNMVDVTDAAQDEQVISLFPNPFSEDLTLQYNATAAHEVQLVLYDVHGRAVWQRLYAHPGGSQTLPLQLPALPKGAYWLKAISPEGCAVTGVVRE